MDKLPLGASWWGTVWAYSIIYGLPGLGARQLPCYERPTEGKGHLPDKRRVRNPGSSLQRLISGSWIRTVYLGTLEYGPCVEYGPWMVLSHQCRVKRSGGRLLGTWCSQDSTAPTACLRGSASLAALILHNALSLPCAALAEHQEQMWILVCRWEAHVQWYYFSLWIF